MTHRLAYGLVFSSPMDIPEFDLADDAKLPTDVTVEVGPVPQSLAPPCFHGACFQAAPREFLLHLPGIAGYLVQDGRHITIDPAPAATDEAVRVFLLSTVLGALLQQRGKLVLHGSAIATDKGAILFLGPSASGKSALAAELWRRGHGVLADELCAVDIGATGPRLVPAPGRLRIWADSLDQLGIPAVGLSRVRPELEKYDLPTHGSFQAPVPIAAFYTLTLSNLRELSLSALTGFDKFRSLTDNTYRLRFAKGMQLLESHFKQVQTLARQVRGTRVVRPRFPFLLKELADLVEKDFA